MCHVSLTVVSVGQASQRGTKAEEILLFSVIYQEWKNMVWNIITEYGKCVYELSLKFPETVNN